MPPQIITAVIGYIVPLAAGGLIGFLSSRYRGLSAIGDGVKCLLRARIIDLHRRTLGSGRPPTASDKQEAASAYHAYHNLGGNDMATALFQEIMNAPTNDKEG